MSSSVTAPVGSDALNPDARYTRLVSTANDIYRNLLAFARPRQREPHQHRVYRDRGLLRDEHLEAVRRGHDAMRGEADMVNRVFRVRLDQAMTFEGLPPPPGSDQ